MPVIYSFNPSSYSYLVYFRVFHKAHYSTFLTFIFGLSIRLFSFIATLSGLLILVVVILAHQ